MRTINALHNGAFAFSARKLFLIGSLVLFNVGAIAQTYDDLIKQIDSMQRGIKTEMSNNLRNITLLRPSVYADNLKALEKAEWMGGDYRKVHDVVECVWDEFKWKTIYGTVEQGEYFGVIVRGHVLSRGSRSGDGVYFVKEFPSGVLKGKRVLFKAKETGETRTVSRFGEVKEYDFGYDAKDPTEIKISAETMKLKREIAFKEALTEMQGLLNDANLKLQAMQNQDRAAEREKRAQEEAQRQKEELARQKIVEAQAARVKKEVEAQDKVLKYHMGQAEKGTSYGLCAMGLRYLKGDGVPKDEKMGKELLEKASAKGNDDAKGTLQDIANYEMGLKYLHGDGVTKDEKRAKELLEKAAVHGYQEAREVLKTLVNN